MKKDAFTLAEVLITLGIVGVVAVLILANLVSGYNKIVWVGQLKSNYTILLNSFSNMSPTTLAESDVFLSLYGAGCGSALSLKDDRCKNFFINLRKYLKGELVELNNYSYSKKLLNPSEKTVYSGSAFILPNGAFLYNFYFFPIGYSSARDIQGNFYIDVNGYNGPNLYGRDIFYFAVILTPPYLVPGGSELCKKTNCTDFPYWKECRGCCKEDNFSPMSFQYSHNCAGRIIEEGWKMNYWCLIKNKIFKIVTKNLQKVWKLLKLAFCNMQVNIDSVPLLEKQSFKHIKIS